MTTQPSPSTGTDNATGTGTDAPTHTGTSTGPARNARVDLVGIVTADLPASLRFYRLLGLPIPEGVDDAPHVEITLDGGMRLAWDPESTVRSFHPDWQPVRGGRIGLALLVDSPADVDAVYEQVTAAGHEGSLAPFDAPWGQRYATVLDPDGNGVDIFAPLP
ncbi:glyoxalase [Flexivirga sp. ID2601S]|uniref:Glyoxalase n=1 Tax=Flexivirga aerilata TaxID=1656889 RepID=A0A849AJS7_9MICO|nr:VOC family protein [Flexivirga aerilata]NNG39786.1 glyoxalase [Flexivirga aerilata]